MSFCTPVALIIFNRPDLTKSVFEKIAKVKPKKLLVIADGPRSSEEADKCQEARSIIDQVDWDCQVLKNFSDTNLTSPIRCSSGLNWVFSEVEEAIILEDDCLPSTSFFYFCQDLLEYYRHDEEVMHISGSNFYPRPRDTPYSYHFSKYPIVWGWATWRRAWKHFDFEMKSWPYLKEQNWIASIHSSSVEQKYWESIFDSCTFGADPHWDYAWMYSCWLKHGKAIIPALNLVSNTGCRSDGTRHRSEYDPLALIPTHEIEKIHHPSADNYELDDYILEFRFNKGRLYSHKKKPTLLDLAKQILPVPIKDKYRSHWNELKTGIKRAYGKIKRQIARPPLPKTLDNSINLHLGCGYVNHPSFINIDALPAPHIHYLRSIDNLSPFKDNTIDLVYASHCLEHFPYRNIHNVLTEWHRVLKPGGILRISVPDFNKIVEIYLSHDRSIDKIQSLLLGGQDYKLNFHMSIFNEENLYGLLKNSGFKRIEKWEPQSCELTNLKDFSSFSVFYNGKIHPISLNIQAFK